MSELRETARHLEKKCALLSEKYEFKIGDLVTWKQGLSSRDVPKSGHPAIVTRVYDTPIYDGEKNSGNAHFREPLDIVCGVMMGEYFVEYHLDSRRLCLW